MVCGDWVDEFFFFFCAKGGEKNLYYHLGNGRAEHCQDGK